LVKFYAAQIAAQRGQTPFFCITTSEPPVINPENPEFSIFSKLFWNFNEIFYENVFWS